jgi:hypothetical protein
MAWLEDIVTQLESNGVGTYGVNIFISTKRGIPVLASGQATLQLIKTGGTAPENTQNSTETPAYSNPGCQITCRAGDWVTAYGMAEKAYLSLFKVRNQFINSGWYRSIKPLQEPFDSGVDERGQVLVRFNVLGSTSQGRTL